MRREGGNLTSLGALIALRLRLKVGFGSAGDTRGERDTPPIVRSTPRQRFLDGPFCALCRARVGLPTQSRW